MPTYFEAAAVAPERLVVVPMTTPFGIMTEGEAAAAAAAAAASAGAPNVDWNSAASARKESRRARIVAMEGLKRSEKVFGRRPRYGGLVRLVYGCTSLLLLLTRSKERM